MRKQLALLTLSYMVAITAPVYAEGNFISWRISKYNNEGYSRDYVDLSADGTKAAGTRRGYNYLFSDPFFWSEETGVIGFDTFPENGGDDNSATEISGDGRVVVGFAGYPQQAFRWTADTGMTGLGNLSGGQYSIATGVNGDGSVIVGHGDHGKVIYEVWQRQTKYYELVEYYDREAFRWTEEEGFVGLGHLTGHNRSYAEDVSEDGNVIVGSSDRMAEDFIPREAFRWTPETGMVGLGALPGDVRSTAHLVSGDGRVVYGISYSDERDTRFRLSFNKIGTERFYRWTATTGMSELNLDALGTVISVSDTNSDGTVIVGSHIDAFSNIGGYRWSVESGAQTLTEWLISTGVASSVVKDITPGAGKKIYVDAVTADGNVVAGRFSTRIKVEGDTGEVRWERAPLYAFIARAGSGMIEPDRVMSSFSSADLVTRSAISQAGAILNSRRGSASVNRGGRAPCIWVTGHWGSNRQGNFQKHALSEIGGCGQITTNIGLSVGAGKAWQDENTQPHASVTSQGFYVIADLDMTSPTTPVWFKLSGLYSESDSSLTREYMNGSAAVAARGDTQVETYGLRGRLGWDSAWQRGALSLTPYVDYAVIRAKSESYLESGTFPAHYNSAKEITHDLRIGTDSAYSLSDSTKLIGTLEAVHRFEGKSAGVSGQLIGLFSFDVAGEDYDTDWFRAAIGVEHSAGNNLFALTLNGTTNGEDPGVWGSARFQHRF